MTETLGPDPLAVFEAWYAEALASSVPAADTMTLATATADGRPSARIVLFKGTHAGGLCFVTNYSSRKAQELAQNPRAALVFFWPALNRQVRFEGIVARASSEFSDRYFATRPRDSQLGAWASPQSRPVESRALLERAVAEASQRFSGQPVPRPEFWGGYRLLPERVEFWLSRDGRLHDRFSYQREGSGWRVERLAP